MRFVFRTDVSAKIGSGHVMRCMTLAEKLRENGASVIFISRAHEGNLNHLVSKKGFQVLELPKPTSVDINKESTNGDDYKAWLGVTEEQDAQETIDAIGVEKPDWLIVDHYSLGNDWEKKIRPYVKKIMAIDDQANRRHDCNLLLDQNWFENMECRYDGLVPHGSTKLLGPEYALLRPEFSKARMKIESRNGPVNRIFVYFGGSDPYNLTGMALRALSETELAHLAVDIVIGENNPHHKELKKLTASRASTYLHVQVDDMAAIMAKANLAIGSGGVNTWERMCLRLPALVISFAENHKALLCDLVKNEYVNYLGSVSDVSASIIKKEILDKISKISNQSEQNNDVFELVDGQGTGKVAKKLNE